ncbi:hypothetical protein [Bacillus pumilus]|uniref:hypothetical protein n=1 Tax=Bacillus pumilus TaxID=1408 RepID=UPI0011A3D8D8|nr:hypothetical protein [Bacillus pumilus]
MQNDEWFMGKFRESPLYYIALSYAEDGKSVSDTLELIIKNHHTRIQLNKGFGERLVVLALIIKQAYEDTYNSEANKEGGIS